MLYRGDTEGGMAEFQTRMYSLLLREQEENDAMDANRHPIALLAYESTNPLMAKFRERVRTLPVDIQDQVLKDIQKAIGDIVVIAKEVDRITSPNQNGQH